jgi:hypothetical protein
MRCTFFSTVCEYPNIGNTDDRGHIIFSDNLSQGRQMKFRGVAIMDKKLQMSIEIRCLCFTTTVQSSCISGWLSWLELIQWSPARRLFSVEKRTFFVTFRDVSHGLGAITSYRCFLRRLPRPQDAGTPSNSTQGTCHLVTHTSPIRAQCCMTLVIKWVHPNVVCESVMQLGVQGEPASRGLGRRRR